MKPIVSFLLLSFLFSSCSNKDSDLNSTLETLDLDIKDQLNSTRKEFISIGNNRDTLEIDKLIEIHNETYKILSSDMNKEEKIGLLKKVFEEKCKQLIQSENNWTNSIDYSLEEIKLQINTLINEMTFIHEAISLCRARSIYSFTYMKALQIQKDKKTVEIYFIPRLDSLTTKVVIGEDDSLFTHKPLEDTNKVIPKYNKDHFTVINKTNRKYNCVLKIRRPDNTFHNYPFKLPAPKDL